MSTIRPGTSRSTATPPPAIPDAVLRTHTSGNIREIATRSLFLVAATFRPIAGEQIGGVLIEHARTGVGTSVRAMMTRLGLIVAAESFRRIARRLSDRTIDGVAQAGRTERLQAVRQAHLVDVRLPVLLFSTATETGCAFLPLHADFVHAASMKAAHELNLLPPLDLMQIAQTVD